jgi:hypothetical protein
LNNGELFKKIKGSKTALADGCISMDGKIIALVSNDRVLTINSEESKIVRNLGQDFPEDVVPLSIDIGEIGNKKLFIVGTSSSTVYIYEILEN